MKSAYTKIILGVIGYLMLIVGGAYQTELVDLSQLFSFQILAMPAFLISVVMLGVFLLTLPVHNKAKSLDTLLILGGLALIWITVGMISLKSITPRCVAEEPERWIFWSCFFKYQVFSTVGVISVLSATLIAIGIKRRTQWEPIFIFCSWIISFAPGPLIVLLMTLSSIRHRHLHL